jgi:hypothetical protein
LAVLRDFLSFGLLYEPDMNSQPMRAFPGWIILAASLLSIALLVRGLRVRPNLNWQLDGVSRPAAGPMLVAAAGMTLLMSGLALLSLPYISSLGPISAFPLAAVTVFPIANRFGQSLRSFLYPLEKRSDFASALTSPVVILAFFPISMVLIAALFKPMIARRALLVFVPYVLIVIAAGARSFSSQRFVAILLAVLLASLFGASAWHFRRMPSSSRDYAGIADVINRHLQKDDVIFVPYRSWSVTPLFYYVDATRLVANDYAGFLAKRPHARVWVVVFGENRREDIFASLKGFRVTKEVTALGARGLLYERPESGS